MLPRMPTTVTVSRSVDRFLVCVASWLAVLLRFLRMQLRSEAEARHDRSRKD